MDDKSQSNKDFSNSFNITYNLSYIAKIDLANEPSLQDSLISNGLSIAVCMAISSRNM